MVNVLAVVKQRKKRVLTNEKCLWILLTFLYLFYYFIDLINFINFFFYIFILYILFLLWAYLLELIVQKYYS